MVRIARREDVPRMLQIYGPYVRDTTVSFEYNIPTESEFLRRFQDITAQFPWIVWEENGKILGYAYASAPFSRAAYAWCAEPSIYLCPEARRKGIGKNLYEALEKILFSQGYRLLYALVTGENRDSLLFHRYMGYRIRAQFPDCGYKFGRWLGLTWMEKSLNFVDSPSKVPTSWMEIVHDDEILSHILGTISL